MSHMSPLDILAFRHFHERFYPQATFGRDGARLILYDSEKPPLYVEKVDGLWHFSLEEEEPLLQTDRLDALSFTLLAPRWYDATFNQKWVGEVREDLHTLAWDAGNSLEYVPDYELEYYFSAALPQQQPNCIFHAFHDDEEYNVVFFEHHPPRITHNKVDLGLVVEVLTEDSSLWRKFRSYYEDRHSGQ